ncbi:hypothetical protein ACFE04_002097 [Oxalis oulophora]
MSIISSKASEIKDILVQGTNSIKHIKHVHASLLKFNLDQDNYLLNMVLKKTLQSGDTNYATFIFNQTKHPNIFLWNTFIRGLVSNDCFHEAIGFFNSMRREGIFPTNFTFPFVLKACARVYDLALGVRIHNLVVKSGFDYDVFEAIDVFKKFLDMGVKPDSFSLVRVLGACSQLGDLSSGEWIDRYVIETGMGTNIFVSTALVDLYAKAGQMEKASAVFNRMGEKDIVTWSTMIQGYASNGHPKEAVNLFYKMLNENMKPDCYVMVGVLSACAKLGGLALGDWASKLMDKNEFLSNAVLGTALIDMYGKCGSMVTAWSVFREMKEKDRVVWNSVMSGLAMNGYEKIVFALFGQMHKSGIRPDGNTFMGLLCACTHSGLADDGRRYFNSMTPVFSLPPSIEHYGCMVDLLGRAGLLDEAHELINSMPMDPNAIVWGALLGGCRLHKDTQLAEHVLKKLIDIEPRNSGNYVLLSNIFSASHRWEDAEKIRSVMSNRSIQKVPGCSWIEIAGVIHEFLVGDTSHPASSKIYAKLEELGRELKQAGFVPATDNVLFDIEDEEKEQFLGHHSEKLAIAFGLISSGPDEVIRVVKNLRVCGDCHESIKLITKITGREISVRDNNRFHSFVDGCCSCNDYW